MAMSSFPKQGLSIQKWFIITAIMVFSTGCESQEEEGGGYSIPFELPGDCKRGTDDVNHEFYDVTQMMCTPCAQNSTYQTTSLDGFSCRCREDYRYERLDPSEGVIRIHCVPCPTNKIASLDGWECVSCDTEALPEDDVICPDCESSDAITAERELTGDWLSGDHQNETRQCVTCTDDTFPDAGSTRCVRCNQILSVRPNGTNDCQCPTERGGLCFQNSNDLEVDNAALFTLVYDDDITVLSALFVDHIQAAQAACTNYESLGPSRLDYSNLTACQVLANLCVLTLYSDEYNPAGQGVANDACSLHKRLVDDYGGSRYPPHPVGVHGIREWRANMPWLFYLDSNADVILTYQGIPQRYASGDVITIMAAKYNIQGEFLGMTQVTSGDIFMCKDEARVTEAAFMFGSKYRRVCFLSVRSLFDDPEFRTDFYDLYLQYEDKGETLLHAIPVRIINSQPTDVTSGDPDDRVNWRLYRRFFLVDQVAGREEGDDSAQVVRYIRDMKLHVELQSDGGDGRILPPWMEITYATVTRDLYDADEEVESFFSVDYKMPTQEVNRGIQIAVGVLSALSVIFSAFQASNYSKREGKIALDFGTMFKFVLFTCGNLAAAFFLAMLGFSLWWLIFYKSQGEMYMVPDDDAAFYIRAYIGSAFALASLHLMHIIYTQVTADIFFIDWEQLPANQSKARPEMTPSSGEEVSVWRTLFVGNEWNELQTVRRINPALQLFLVIIVLSVAGVENIARFDTSSLTTADTLTRGDYSVVLRFGLSSAVFLAVAIGLWMLYSLVWSRFKDNPILNFIDLCSMTNISVFIMTHAQYGHYIHGRSSHGCSDVSLLQLAEQLKREEYDLCGGRGLMTHSDQQTFEVFIPKKLRREYNQVLHKVLVQRAETRQTGRSRGSSRLSEQEETQIEAYKVLNRYLRNFIDHNVREVDYMVVSKRLYERVLDTETILDFEQGYFYPDYGHSFDRALFFGQERSLQLFSVLFFSVMDMAGNNFVLAAILTYLLDEFIRRVRSSLGTNNIAKKTMVDQRFLI